MKNKKILISGMGIAGTTLAYWLLKYGFEPTILEKYPSRRTGGYMIDFMGTGYEVAERMQIIPVLKDTGYWIDEIKIVDKQGKKTGSVSGQVFTKANKDKFIPILRGDLADVIYATIENKVPSIFGDTIEAIEPDENSINIQFSKSGTAAFNLLIGADGLHSNVRKQIFGPERQFENYLGYHTAAFIVQRYPYRDENSYKGYYMPNRQVWRYSLPNDRTAISFIFLSPKLDVRNMDIDEQKNILRTNFNDGGWECPLILEYADRSEDLYFDSISQMRMQDWYAGRVALVGDACFAPSLVSGQGSSFAMAGAYILAGELKDAAGDYKVAYAKYQQRFKNFIDKRQLAAANSLKWFAPNTPLRVWLTAKATNLLKIPFISNMMMKGYMADRFDLPNYKHTKSLI